MANPAPISYLMIFLAIMFTFMSLLSHPTTASTDYVIYSDPPTVLLPGQKFTYDLTPENLPFGPFETDMQSDCNLVLLSNHSVKTWATNTSGMGENCYLTVDSYGEAFVYRNYHYPVWRSNVKSVLGSYALLMQHNGGLATVGPAIWESDNKPELSHSNLVNYTKDYVFYSYTVTPIKGRIGDYKNYKVYLNDDCNLVVVDTDSGKIKWETNTHNDRHDCFVTMDGNGELFIKYNRRDILWRSGKSFNSCRPGKSSTYCNYIMVLRYDGKLVIYGPQVWTTKLFW